MKKIIFSILQACLVFSTIKAQSPQAINYQVVVRNNTGDVIKNQAVRFRLSITEGANGAATYVETHQATTNILGLVNLTIGAGTVASGTFANINWSSSQKYLKVEVDITGGTNYTNMGTQSFVSVPYALFSEKAGNGTLWSKNSLGINYNGGNVGVGTNTPISKLQIESDADGFSENETRNFIFIKNTSSANASAAGIGIQSGSLSGETRLWHISPQYSFRPQDQDFGTLYSSGKGLSIWSSNRNSPTTGRIKFQVGGDNTGGFDRMVIDEQGYIGINTSSPSARLHVDGGVRFSNISQNNSNTRILSTDINGNITWRDASTLTSNNNTNAWNTTGNSASSSDFIGTNNAQDIRFRTNGTQKAVLNTDGNFGIGTTTPISKLQLEGSADGLNSNETRNFIFIKNTSSSNASAAGIGIQSGSSSGETRLWHISPQYSSRPQDQDYGTLFSSGKGLSIWSSNRNNASTGRIKFQTGADANGGFDRMVIDEQGNIGINNSSPKSKLQITNGDVYVDDATKGIILKSPNGSCWRVTIDNSGNFIRTSITCPN